VRCLRFQEIDWDLAKPALNEREAVKPGGVVLRVENLTKHYTVESRGALRSGARRTVKANEKITFRAHEAETIAIVGESGCGKSTFAKVLMGLEDATGGKIELGDLDLPICPCSDATTGRSRACR